MSNQIHTFVVITQGDGKPGELKFRTLFATRNEGAMEEMAQLLLEQNSGFKRASYARNAREVVVMHVDAKEHEKWLHEPGRNGLVSKPVARGRVFRSATEASGHIGLRHNEIAMMLSRCAQTGENQATVRGVSFAYKDDVK